MLYDNFSDQKDLAHSKRSDYNEAQATMFKFLGFKIECTVAILF